MSLESSDVLFSGITYDGGKGFLPLTNLDVQTLIVDTSSRVTLSQTYFYDDSTLLCNAFYLFPIPLGAIVCGFEMWTSDEVHIEGVVKSINEVEGDYRQILGDNDVANIVLRSPRDVLVLSLGSFLPRTSITISITYVIDLFDSNEAIIKFRLPSYVGRCSPKLSTSTQSPIRMAPAFYINLDIEMPGEILYVYSNLPLQDIPLPSSTKNPSCIARKKLVSTDMNLDTDFLLSVQALGLDQSRCFLEQWQNSAALSLNVVPSVEDNHTNESCEYIFLIDRSWSMCMDDKMEKTKLVMSLLLKTLPIKNTWFNIYSFEHSHDSIWLQSQPFHQITLREALNFISHLDPRGGTELFPVFQSALVNRRVDVTTKIFMLTDGEVHYPQRTIDLVTQAIHSADPVHPIKVFTLAIGSSASDALCEGLAKAGSGVCLKTSDGEGLTRKCTNILNKMMLPDIHELKINWNVNGTVYQAPIDLTRCSKGCLSVKAIIPRGDIPETVSIIGKTSNGTQIHYTVPVLTAQTLHSVPNDFSGTRASHSRPLFHTVAANNLCRDLERAGTAKLIPGWEQLSPSLQSSKIKEELLRLGFQYNIINSMVTFVALDRAGEQEPNSINPIAPNVLTPTANPNNEDLPPSRPPELDSRHSSPLSSKVTDFSDSSSSEDAGSRPLTPFSSPGLPDMPGAFPRPPPNRKAFIVQTESVPDDQPDETYIFRSVPPTHFVVPPLRHEKIVVSYSNPIRMFVHRSPSGEETNTEGISDRDDSLDSIPEDPKFDEKFADLIDMQWYDGSFPDIHQLNYVIGCRNDDDIPLYSMGIILPSSINYESLCATALAVKYLRKHCPHKWIIWKDLARKSMTWGRNACGDLSTFERIIAYLPLLL